MLDLKRIGKMLEGIGLKLEKESKTAKPARAAHKKSSKKKKRKK